MTLPSNPSSTTPTSPSTYTLKVGSLNVWNPGPNPLEREKGLAALMREADIVLLQELNSKDRDQVKRLAGLAGMKYAESVDDIGIASVHPFSDFRPHEVKYLFALLPLSEMKLKYVPFCYARFLINGRIHHVFSNHWDHRDGEKYRDSAALAAMKAIKSLPEEDIILFGGDFNEVRGKRNVEAFVLASELKDALRPDQDTHCPEVTRVDMIFQRGLTTQSYQAECPSNDPNTRPTDHPFLLVEFSVTPHLPVS
jgi:endonuclease/exonuclease/phosphatase (EEP) superfamily protein YafD